MRTGMEGANPGLTLSNKLALNLKMGIVGSDWNVV